MDKPPHSVQCTLMAHMLREAYNQTQREILASHVSYHLRWERMAEVLNTMMEIQTESRKQQESSIAQEGNADGAQK